MTPGYMNTGSCGGGVNAGQPSPGPDDNASGNGGSGLILIAYPE